MACMMFPAHLATMRRSVQPTAIGLTLPSFFSRDINEAPKLGHALDEAFPSKIWLVN